jgi:hypothetical protein
MRALSTVELLTVWELGAEQRAAQRALTLLAAATDDDSTGQLVQLSLGQCDERLLTLRESTFGPQLSALSACPSCDETLQFEINAGDIRQAPASEPGESIELTQGEYGVRFRLPNNLDIIALDPNADNEENRAHLLRRCVLTARRAQAAIATEDLPSDVVTALADRMAEADPQADVQLALACPQCGHSWHSPLDIASFFWSEINAWARRLLNDVHTLASAYGWNEAEILALSATRRQAYLELVRQ